MLENLIAAIRENDLAAVKALSKTVFLGAVNNWAIRVAVEAAARRNDADMEVVKFLLKQPGVDPRALQNHCLQLAIAYADRLLIDVLLTWQGPHGEEINILDVLDDPWNEGLPWMEEFRAAYDTRWSLLRAEWIAGVVA